MTVYVLTVDNEVVGVYDEYTKAYDIGCSKYDGDFDIDEFEVEQKCVFHVKDRRIKNGFYNSEYVTGRKI